MIRQTSYYCCSIVLDIGPFYPFTIAADTDIVFIIRTLVYTQIKSAARRHSSTQCLFLRFAAPSTGSQRIFIFPQDLCTLCFVHDFVMSKGDWQNNKVGDAAESLCPNVTWCWQCCASKQSSPLQFTEICSHFVTLGFFCTFDIWQASTLVARAHCRKMCR